MAPRTLAVTAENQPPTPPADIPLPADACIVLLDRPGNPGNLGSIVKSCDAFGASGIVVTGHSVDPGPERRRRIG